MSLTGWPTVTDDSGTKQDGTVINKTLTDAMRDAIEDAIESPTNPGDTVVEIIDEVVAARGSEASLDDRLDVSLNEDGTLKSSAVSTTSIGSQVGQIDLVVNGRFSLWPSGAAAAPGGWTLTTSTLARTGAGEADTFTFGNGKYAAKLTGAGNLSQDIVGSTLFADRYTGLRSRDVSAVVRVKTSVPSSGRIAITDGVLTTYSSYHTGGGGEEDLTVVHSISPTATKLTVQLLNDQTGAVYFGGVSAVLSSVAPSGHVIPRANLNRSLFLSGTDHATSGTGATAVYSYSLLAGEIQDGEVLVFEAYGDQTADANNKTYALTLGSTTITSGAQNINNANWRVQVRIVRVSASVQRVFADFILGNNNFPSYAAWTENLDSTLALTLTITHATAGVTTARVVRARVEGE